MAEMTEFEKRRAAEAARLEKEKKKPKKKKKKEATPEEIQAQLEEERQLIKSFYLQRWQDVKKKSALFNTYIEEGFPGSEYQQALSESDALPLLHLITSVPLDPFAKILDGLVSVRDLRKDEVRRYGQSSQKYAEYLLEKSKGAGAANLPPLPGALPPKKRVELRSRFVVEYLIQKSLEKGTLANREGELVVETADEVAALNLFVVEWFPLRDIQKMEKPKEKGELVYLVCTREKCPTKYIYKLFCRCGACGAPYCSHECQKEDWVTHQHEQHCNGTLSRQINKALRLRNTTKLSPYLPYLKLLFYALSKVPVVDGYVWHSMAFLQESAWNEYAKLVPKADGDDRRGSTVDGSRDRFVWTAFTVCSVARSKAEAVFNRKAVRTPRILFEIKAIEGYRISGYVEPQDTNATIPVAQDDKDEVLLPPCSIFKVVSSTITGTLLHIVCEQIGQPYTNMDRDGGNRD